MGCGQSKIHLYPRKSKSKANGKKGGHGKQQRRRTSACVCVCVPYLTVCVCRLCLPWLHLNRHTHTHAHLHTHNKSLHAWRHQFACSYVWCVCVPCVCVCVYKPPVFTMRTSLINMSAAGRRLGLAVYSGLISLHTINTHTHTHVHTHLYTHTHAWSSVCANLYKTKKQRTTMATTTRPTFTTFGSAPRAFLSSFLSLSFLWWLYVYMRVCVWVCVINC